MPSDTRPPETHELKVGEQALVYCFDFSGEPAVTAGATLSLPTVTAENGKVTVASPTVLTADFVQYDADGETVATVPSGKGVKFLVTAVSKGQCKVTCNVTASDGQKPSMDVNFLVK